MKKLNINETDILLFSLNNDFPANTKWLYDMLTFIAEDEYEDDYIKLENKVLYFKKNDELIEITDKYENELFDFKDIVVLEKDSLPNVTKKIETTVGRVIMNYLLLCRNFNNKIPYINKPFDIGYIENNYIKNLLTDDKNATDKIQIEEYKQFMDTVLYIDGISKLLSLAATEKAILPPKDIDKIKKQLKEKYIKKYGKDPFKDKKLAIQYENDLKKIDEEWLKDDPSFGRLISGKVKNQARKKLFLTIGAGNTFSNDAKHIERSLEEGWDLDDPETLAIMFNEGRAASFSRGAETQLGGVTAKTLLRATTDVEVIKTDCGSTLTIDILLTEANKEKLINRYILENNKPLLLTVENIDKYMNKTVQLRTPLYCKLNINFCTTCLGEKIKNYKKGISILGLEIGGAILKIALAKFHATDTSATKMDIFKHLK